MGKKKRRKTSPSSSEGTPEPEDHLQNVPEMDFQPSAPPSPARSRTSDFDLALTRSSIINIWPAPAPPLNPRPQNFQPAILPKFKALPDETRSSYAAVAAIEKKHPGINITARPNLEGHFTITPRDQTAADLLKNDPSLQLLDPNDKLKKAIICGVPTALPIELFTALTIITTASRFIGKSGTPTRKILATFRGPIPSRVSLGIWGSFPTETYIPEPLRCYRCQRYGHHKSRCTGPEICGVCSRRHPTQNCIDLHKEGKPTTAKCPNCKESHHAWFKGCSTRLARLNIKTEHTASPTEPPRPAQRPRTVPTTTTVTTLLPRPVQLQQARAISSKTTVEISTQTEPEELQPVSPPETAHSATTSEATTQVSPRKEPPPAIQSTAVAAQTESHTEDKETITNSTETCLPYLHPADMIGRASFVYFDPGRFQQIMDLLKPNMPRASHHAIYKVGTLIEKWISDDNPGSKR